MSLQDMHDRAFETRRLMGIQYARIDCRTCAQARNHLSLFMMLTILFSIAFSVHL